MIVLISIGMITGCTQTPQQKCEADGGVWIEKQIGGFLDLDVTTHADCITWEGTCGEPRIISSFTIGTCSNGEDCWRPDIWEPTCLIPEK